MAAGLIGFCVQFGVGHLQQAIDIRFSVPSDPAAMTFVRVLVEKAAALCGFDDKQIGGIVLAVDEACTNIIRHQYENRHDERIDIAVIADEADGRLRFIIRDYGPTREADDFRGRDLADVRPGGLGLHLIRQIMDTVEYSPADGGGMQLELAKGVPAGVEGQ